VDPEAIVEHGLPFVRPFSHIIHLQRSLSDRSAIPSSTISLSLKRKTWNPFTTDPCIGCASVGLSALLDQCAGDKGALIA
jgi:hypothetical protein